MSAIDARPVPGKKSTFGLIARHDLMDDSPYCEEFVGFAIGILWILASSVLRLVKRMDELENKLLDLIKRKGWQIGLQVSRQMITTAVHVRKEAISNVHDDHRGSNYDAICCNA
jgi:hypothetical protein